jgi:hypothetical protein
MEDEEEDVSNYWKTLRKQEYTGIWRRKHYFPLSEELTLEEAMDLSQEKLRDDENNTIFVTLQAAHTLCYDTYTVYRFRQQ